tara:strand:+ start:174 stop:338 length:165 start_codon:yes stop_codon:yes gene_type:complete
MNRDRELQVFLITLLFVSLFFFLAYQWVQMSSPTRVLGKNVTIDISPLPGQVNE